jgi:hypothetical protein
MRLQTSCAAHTDNRSSKFARKQCPLRTTVGATPVSEVLSSKLMKYFEFTNF